MMNSAVIYLILLNCVALTFSHLCLLSPPQRGSISGLNKAGSDDCILTKSPCGGRSAQRSGQLKLKAGSNFTVIFQKNLDHFTEATPGYFSIAFGVDEMNSSFQEVANVKDMGEPSLHLYLVPVTIPALLGHPDKILQVSYITKNSQAPPAFYQCADIMAY